MVANKGQTLEYRDRHDDAPREDDPVLAGVGLLVWKWPKLVPVKARN